MKRANFFMPFLALMSILLFSFTGKNRTYQTQCVTIETDGYVTIKIWNAKKGAKYKAELAQQDAIHSLLYSGISQGLGCSTQPPMLNTTEEQDEFKKLEKKFFAKKGDWSRFTKSSTPETTLPTELGEKNWKVFQVSVSKNELRKYLEEQEVIKPLNQGF